MKTLFNTPRFRERAILATLAAIQFIHIVDFMVIMPLGPHFLQELTISTTQFTILISAYTVSAGVAGFVASFFLDRLDRKKALVTMMAGFTLGTLFCGLGHTYITLLMARVVTGLFGGVLASLVLAILGDIIPEERRGKATGIVMSAFSIASILGVPFGLFLANSFSWEAPFLFLAGLGVLVLLLAIKVVPNIAPEPESQAAQDTRKNSSVLTQIRATLRVRFSDKNQLKALLLTSVLMLGQFSVIPLISTFMVSNVGFTMENLTLIYVLGGLGSFVSAPISGALSDRFGQKPVFLVFSICCTVPLIWLTNLTAQPLLIPLAVTTVLFITSSGRMVAGMALILSSVTKQHRAGFMSLNSCIQQLSAGFASFVAGMIVSQNTTGQLTHYSVVGYVAATTSVIAICIAYQIGKRTDDEPSLELAEEQEITELLLT